MLVKPTSKLDEGATIASSRFLSILTVISVVTKNFAVTLGVDDFGQFAAAMTQLAGAEVDIIEDRD